jgi:c-di-GMP-binding flagellar brake protein YcgR
MTEPRSGPVPGPFPEPNSAPRTGTAAAAATDLERFQIHDRLEMLGVLRALVDRRALVTVVYEGGSLFFVSALLAIAPEREEIVFDCGPDAEVNAKLLASSRITFATLLDNIRIQFHAYSTSEVVFEGRPALAIAIPEAVMRLQRREHYRLQIPQGQHVVCEVRRDPAEEKTLQLGVYDISCGGIALTGWPAGQALETQHVYRGCRLMFSANDIVVTDLEVVYVIDRTDSDGTRIKRCGARFVDLPGMLVTRVQRYITRLERELHALQERKNGGRGVG